MDGLPVGFRFYPTEEELVSFYLANKLQGTRPDIDPVIPVVDIYDYNPWDLPQFAGERCPADMEQWFFFVPRQERETRGGRPNRLTQRGYWKATGSPGEVYSSTNQRIGRKKTMVFYEGRAPNGKKTAWKMNEYKVFDQSHREVSSSSDLQVREEISLCRIYKRSKCLRSFDRRPPTEEVAGGREVVHHHQQPPETTDQAAAVRISNQEDNERVMAPDHITTNPSQSMEESVNLWDIAADNIEPLWDWEEFNWFDI